MVETYYAGVYWGRRNELVSRCAERAEIFLKCLMQRDLGFTRWFAPGSSRQEALNQPVRVDASDLEVQFRKTLNKASYVHSVGQELGYGLSLWNGEGDEASIGVNLACGSHSPSLGNFCTIDLPATGPMADRILRARTLIQIMNCLIEAWEPEWGTVTSRNYRNEFRPKGSGIPMVGWLTYLSVPSIKISSLLPTATVTPLGENGTLIITTPERFTVENPNHVAMANRISSILSESSIIKRNS